MNLAIRDSGDLARLVRSLRKEGGGDLRQSMSDAMMRGSRTAEKSVRSAALSWLPRRGGFAAEIARAKVVSNPLSFRGRDPSVRITGTAFGRDLHRIDLGVLRHPVYGNDWWVGQEVRPGWFTETIKTEVVPRVESELGKAADAVGRRVTRS